MVVYFITLRLCCVLSAPQLSDAEIMNYLGGNSKLELNFHYLIDMLYQLLESLRLIGWWDSMQGIKEKTRRKPWQWNSKQMNCAEIKEITAIMLKKREFVWVVAGELEGKPRYGVFLYSVFYSNKRSCCLCASRPHVHMFTCNPFPFKMTAGSRPTLTTSVDIRTTWHWFIFDCPV